MVIVRAMKMNALRIYGRLQKQNSERQMQQWDGGIGIGDAMGGHGHEAWLKLGFKMHGRSWGLWGMAKTNVV